MNTPLCCTENKFLLIFMGLQNTTLTLTMPNFLNGIIRLPILELSIIIFRGIKMRTWSWWANSIELGKTARMYRLAWLYTSDKGWSLSVNIQSVLVFQIQYLLIYSSILDLKETIIWKQKLEVFFIIKEAIMINMSVQCE